MAGFRAVFYRDTDGREPVADLLLDLSPKARVAVRNQIDRLNLLSDEMPHLPFPHSSQVDGELRELRCHFGRDHYRVMYARSERLLVLLHAFRKGTGQLPRAEVDIAAARWEAFKDRMNARPRLRPRAAGHDAP